jgi:outer membrane protein assembly factor BamB
MIGGWPRWVRSGATAVTLVAGGPAAGRGASGLRPAALHPQPGLRVERATAVPGEDGVFDSRGRVLYQWDIRGKAWYLVGYEWRGGWVLWRVRVPDYTQPAGVTAGVVVCHSGSVSPWAPLSAYDARDGARLWSEPGTAAARYGLVGLAVRGGQVFEVAPALVRCLDARTGRTLWTVDYGQDEAGAGWPHDPVIAGPSLYTQAGGRVLALDARTGRVRWWHAAGTVSIEAGGQHCVGPVAVSGHRVVALTPVPPHRPAATETDGAIEGELTCWDSGSGRQLWQRPAASWSNQPLLVSGGVVCLRAGGNSTAYGYSLRSGRCIWRLPESRTWYLDPDGPWRAVAQGLLVEGLRETAAPGGGGQDGQAAGPTRRSRVRAGDRPQRPPKRLSGRARRQADTSRAPAQWPARRVAHAPAFLADIEAATGRVGWRLLLPNSQDIVQTAVSPRGDRVLAIDSRLQSGTWQTWLYVIRLGRGRRAAGGLHARPSTSFRVKPRPATAASPPAPARRRACLAGGGCQQS